VYGEKGGFESLDEAFGPYAKHIYAVETGLSSNPSMNWRIKELDHRAIVSFSDAHSGPKLGREATVFDLQEMTYDNIYQAISQLSVLGSQLSDRSQSVISQSVSDKQKTGKLLSENRQQKTDNRIAYTIEFYPEEGKYHWSGHRACGVRWGPAETAAKGTTCPACGKPLTQGVEQRVNQLASRSEAELKLVSMRQRINASEAEVIMTKSETFPNRPPFVMLVPLQEIISECIGSPVASPKVQGPYATLTDALDGEFHVLLQASIDEIAKVVGDRIAQGVDKVRRGDLVIDPGYDGVFGVVKIWREGEEKPLLDASREQLSIFS
jgi:PHP family Zn ribbon phosphoesterase